MNTSLSFLLITVSLIVAYVCGNRELNFNKNGEKTNNGSKFHTVYLILLGLLSAYLLFVR